MDLNVHRFLKRIFIIVLLALTAFFSSAGRGMRVPRAEHMRLPIVSDTVVYKLDSLGAAITDTAGVPIMDTAATELLRWQLDTLSQIFWSLDSLTLDSIDTIIQQYNDSLVRSLPDARDIKAMVKQLRQEYRDSVIKNTPRILETFVLPDSLWYKRIVSWTHNQDNNEITLRTIDTGYNYHFFENPIQKDDVDAVYLGVIGSASQQYNYFRRKKLDIAPFFTPYMEYSYTPETVPMYNTKTPYTELAYWGNPFISKEKEENDLSLLSTQNITPALNMTFAYRRYGGGGMLTGEETSNKTFYIGANHIGKKYEMHFGYLGQNVARAENGGVKDIFWVCDTVVDAKAVETNLKDADTYLKRRTLFLTQSLAVPMNFFRKSKDTLAVGEGTVMYLGHSLELSKYTKLYSDKLVSEDEKMFYDNQLNIYGNSSHDSLAVHRFENKFFATLQPFGPDAIVSKINGGFGLQAFSYYGFAPADFVTGPKKNSYLNTYFYGGASGKFKKYIAWDAAGKMNLLGYYAGDMNLEGNLKLSVYPIKEGIHLTGHVETSLKTPHPFEQTLYFNHHSWNNEFDRTSESRVEAELSIPHWKLSAFFGYALVGNMLYYDAVSDIRQADEVVQVISAYLTKNFAFGPVHLDHKLLYQVTSNDNVLPLPPLSMNLRYYFQFPLVKNVMTIQLGANGVAYSKYYLPAYSPDLGVFYNQRTQEWGNNPYVDAFVNIQWKRAAIFVKYTNVLSGWPATDYFSACNYIRPGKTLKFGIYWPFYAK